MNKNVSVWRGDNTPPSNYHLWIKSDGSQWNYNNGVWENFLDTLLKTATSKSDGLLSKEDKVLLDELNNNLNTKVDKVENKSLVDDSEIIKLLNLPNVDQLSDLISTAQSSGDNALADLDKHIQNTANPHNVTKEQIGLDNVTNDSQVKRSEMGLPYGVATLDSTGLVPASLLPAYVDDVLEFVSVSNFPEVGESDKIYVSKDTNLTYRWSGTGYIEISQSLALGETSSTAYPGDKGKALSESNAKHTESLNNILETIPEIYVRSVSAKTDGSLKISNVTITNTDGVLSKTNRDTFVQLPEASSSNKGIMSIWLYNKLNALNKEFIEILDDSLNDTEYRVNIKFLAFDDEAKTSYYEIHSVTIPAATESNVGVMTPTQVKLLADNATKLESIEVQSGAIDSFISSLSRQFYDKDIRIVYNVKTYDLDSKSWTDKEQYVTIPHASNNTGGILSTEDKKRLDGLDVLNTDFLFNTNDDGVALSFTTKTFNANTWEVNSDNTIQIPYASDSTSGIISSGQYNKLDKISSMVVGILDRRDGTENYYLDSYTTTYTNDSDPTTVRNTITLSPAYYNSTATKIYAFNGLLTGIDKYTFDKIKGSHFAGLSSIYDTDNIEISQSWEDYSNISTTASKVEDLGKPTTTTTSIILDAATSKTAGVMTAKAYNALSEMALNYLSDLSLEYDSTKVHLVPTWIDYWEDLESVPAVPLSDGLSTGTISIDAATATTAGVMTANQYSKLTGFANSVNDTPYLSSAKLKVEDERVALYLEGRYFDSTSSAWKTTTGYTTIPLASETSLGLMSKEDKTNLDSLIDELDWYWDE